MSKDIINDDALWEPSSEAFLEEMEIIAEEVPTKDSGKLDRLKRSNKARAERSILKGRLQRAHNKGYKGNK